MYKRKKHVLVKNLNLRFINKSVVSFLLSLSCPLLLICLINLHFISLRIFWSSFFEICILLLIFLNFQHNPRFVSIFIKFAQFSKKSTCTSETYIVFPTEEMVINILCLEFTSPFWTEMNPLLWKRYELRLWS